MLRRWLLSFFLLHPALSRRVGDEKIAAVCKAEEVFPPLVIQPANPVTIHSTCTVACAALDLKNLVFHWAYCPTHAVVASAPADFASTVVYFNEPRLAVATSTRQRSSRKTATRRSLVATKRKQRPRLLPDRSIKGDSSRASKSSLGVRTKSETSSKRRRPRWRKPLTKRKRDLLLTKQLEQQQRHQLSQSPEARWRRGSSPVDVPKLWSSVRRAAAVSGQLAGIARPMQRESFEVSVLPLDGKGSGTMFPPGLTEVTFEAVLTRDDCRGEGSSSRVQLQPCKFYVDVRDEVPPEFIFCPKDREFTLLPSQRGIKFHYDRPVAKDNSDRIVTITMVRGSESGETLGIGDHKFEYIATDESGNVARCRWRVRVRSRREDNSL